MGEKKDSLEQIIRDELKKEAEDIKREVGESGIEPMPEELKNDIREKLHAQIEAYEKERLYAQLSKEDQKALELGRKLMNEQAEEKEEKKVVRKKMRVRGYVAVAAAVVFVLAFGMTSMGGAERIIKIVKSQVGDREIEKVNSNEDNLVIAKENEEEAYQKVSDMFGTEPVKLMYHPEGMEFDSVEINMEFQTAELLFEYKNENVIYIVNASYSGSSWGTDVEDELINKYYYKKDNGPQIEIKEYQISKTNRKRYSARFSYGGLEYMLVGTMKREYFDEIIKNLYFFE